MVGGAYMLDGAVGAVTASVDNMDARDEIRERIMKNLEKMESGWDDGAYVCLETDTVDGSLSSVVNAVLDMFWVEILQDREARFVRDADNKVRMMPKQHRIVLTEKESGCL